MCFVLIHDMEEKKNICSLHLPFSSVWKIDSLNINVLYILHRSSYVSDRFGPNVEDLACVLLLY